MAPPAYQQLIADEGIDRVTAGVTADRLEAVSALADLGLADEAHVSIFGMSMGARFGLPTAAAFGPRLQCAVFGKFGIRQAEPLHPGLCAPRLILAAARATTAPVLYHVQQDDAIFPAMASSNSPTRWPRQASARSVVLIVGVPPWDLGRRLPDASPRRRLRTDPRRSTWHRAVRESGRDPSSVPGILSLGRTCGVRR